MPESPFLALSPSAHVASNELAFAIRDAYPVSPGHTLIVPRRLVETWFDATKNEQRAILALVDEVRRQLDAELRPDGYNVGFNAGTAAGQTVPHLHVHVIPRFDGDVPDPRGGVRHVMPARARPEALGIVVKGHLPPKKTKGVSMWARREEVGRVLELRVEAHRAMAGRAPLRGPLAVTLEVHLRENHLGIGGLDSMLSGVLDALQRSHRVDLGRFAFWKQARAVAVYPHRWAAFEHDYQVVDVVARKIVGPAPGVPWYRLTLAELT